MIDTEPTVTAPGRVPDPPLTNPFVQPGQWYKGCLHTHTTRSDGNPLDASNEDGSINITNWPVKGMYQPDAIAAFQAGGQTYLITANEGGARDYDEIYAYGARSFSIWGTNGALVYDSGDEIAQITVSQYPAHFNSDGEHDSFDDRSDDKGAEPEGVTTGVVGGRTYAFVGLEPIGGVMVFDFTSPTAPAFVQYVNTRNFDGVLEEGTAGDVSPEGLKFISADKSPISKALLVVAFEVSGTTTVFEINEGASGELPQTGGEGWGHTPALLLLVAGTGLLAAGYALRRWAGVRT